MGLDRDTTFTWYGHSCYEVRTPGDKVILIDPYFANPRSPRTADSIQRCDLLLAGLAYQQQNVLCRADPEHDEPRN